MNEGRKKRPNGTDQRQRFVDAARTAETDDDTEAFKERLKKLVSAPIPKPVSERKKPSKKG